MRNIYLLSSLFLLLALLPAAAQTTATEHIVYALFDKPDKVQWLRHYHGRLDGISEVGVSLAYDGKRCKGLMTYLRSKEAIQLEGVLKNNVLNLKEINREGQTSGALRGEWKGKEILAEWVNLKEDVASILTLKQVEKEVKTPSYCGEEMWIKSFTGTLPNDKLRLIIQRVEEGQLRGIAHLGSAQESFRAIGEIDEEGDYKILLENADYRLQAEMMGTFSEASNQSATFTKTGEKASPIGLRLESHLYMGCQEFTDYSSSFDVIYPKTVNAAFNNWMEAEVNRWMKNCKAYAHDVRTLNPKQKTGLRSAIRAYGWSDIDFYSPEVISGFMTYDKTWIPQPESFAFNFDLKKGEEITLDDIFRKDFDVAIFVLEYLHNHQAQTKWFEDPEYRKWLQGRDFPFFTIREEGICFCTAYHSLYGRHELTIPYSELKPYMKKRNNPVIELMN